MEQYYLEVRSIHIVAAMCSGILLLIRGVAYNGLSAFWVMKRPVRILSNATNIILLSAAAALTLIVRQFPIVDSWLSMKLLLLLGYLVLGHSALKGRSVSVRWASLGGAMLAFLSIVGVARAHSPLAFFA